MKNDSLFTGSSFCPTFSFFLSFFLSLFSRVLKSLDKSDKTKFFKCFASVVLYSEVAYNIVRLRCMQRVIALGGNNALFW